MTLTPATWSRLLEDARTQIIIESFVGFFDLDHLAPNEISDDFDESSKPMPP
jgi:hypothetical protein